MQPSDRIKSKAHALGFELVGISPAKSVSDFDFFRWWLDQGFASSMNYLKRGLEKRGDPELVLPGVRSIICCGLNYYSGQERVLAGGSAQSCSPVARDRAPDPQPPAPESYRARISSYAWGEDYHRIVGEKLAQLAEFIQKEIDPGAQTKTYVDTGPILERSYAAQAGLGWIGKNTCLINNGLGSFFFIGEILTSLLLDYDRPTFDQCGSCTKCLDACPTGALPEPGILDATKCISYLTIEYKGEFTDQQKQMVGNHLYGCDICQEVCPYNDRIQASSHLEFYPRELFRSPDLEELAKVDERGFEAIRQGSAMERIRWGQWRRNLEACRNNKGR
ncbi:MAG: tRNA epoxyqueuosine(34) reductase QueG [Deltaproteobacteria bacterium]|nr:tRNA epoxyqueuosine(34) reductase QueG [Deltaproteobacteria bacterium]